MTNFPARPEPPDADAVQQLSDDELGALQQSISPLLQDDGDPRERAELLDLIAAEMIRCHPDRSGWWYDRGMYAKWRSDWEAARDFSRQALELLSEQTRQGEAAAWNLGIAATALRDWPTARAAWTMFGIPLPDGKPDDPIVTDFGPAPVRLNPDPRFVGQRRLLIDGQAGAAQVVWGARLCPARIRVLNVPTPQSGHRFGDVVLHDGDTLGTRQLADGEELGVFNEIALWERSPMSTLAATLDVVAPLLDEWAGRDSSRNHLDLRVALP